MAQWSDEKSVQYGIGPRSWQGWLLIMAMIVVVIGACLAATRLTDLPRWMPLVVIVLAAAGAIILSSMTREGERE
jgi:hypothetical protein